MTQNFGIKKNQDKSDDEWEGEEKVPKKKEDQAVIMIKKKRRYDIACYFVIKGLGWKKSIVGYQHALYCISIFLS